MTGIHKNFEGLVIQIKSNRMEFIFKVKEKKHKVFAKCTFNMTIAKIISP